MLRLKAALFFLFIPLQVSASDDLFHIEQRIVNGSLSNKHPAVASLLSFDNIHQRWQSICSASLIDDSTVLTAGHCVCKSSGNDCQAGETNAPDPKQFLIYFPNAGFFEIDSISLSEQFDFPTSDYAVINLTNNVSAIDPLILVESQPRINRSVQLAGYGKTSRQDDASSGLLRIGTTLLDSCDPIDLNNSDFLCWNHSPETQFANSCNGDSGGTLLSSNGETLLGIISGGINNCEQVDTGFATAISAIRNEVIARSDYQKASEDPTLIIDNVYATSDNVDAFNEKKYRFLVKSPSTEKIVISSNATDTFGIQTELAVESDDDMCKSAMPGSFQSCEIKVSGDQVIDISLQNNSNEEVVFQLMASELQSFCNLDVDNNGSANALTDGLLIVRAMFGFQGDALIDTTVAVNSKRKTSEAILNYINSDTCKVAMDIDRNGSLDALTDGIVILRYLFGVRGNELIEGITKSNRLTIYNKRLALLSLIHKTTYLELQSFN